MIHMLDWPHFFSVSVLHQHLRPWVLASPSILVMGRDRSRSASRSATPMVGFWSEEHGRATPVVDTLLQDLRNSTRGGDGGGGRSTIQEMVDERTQCRRNRDFDKADRLRDELKDMGVRIDDTDGEGGGGSWSGPNGEGGAWRSFFPCHLAYTVNGEGAQAIILKFLVCLHLVTTSFLFLIRDRPILSPPD